MAFCADNNAASASGAFREAVCIDTRRIYDACSDRDCLSGLQIAFSSSAQPVVDEASAIKARCAEVIGVFFEVEPVAFNRGFYSVDMTYYFKVHFSAYTNGTAAPTPVEGLAAFCKKVILFGSEASVKTFSTENNAVTNCSSMPIVNVQVIDPMILSCDVCDCTSTDGPLTRPISAPEEVLRQFSGSFDDVPYTRCVTLSLGMFSIVQLERQVQVMIPIYDFCIPEKNEQPQAGDPCELFGRIAFPTEEFFPPRLADLESDEA